MVPLEHCWPSIAEAAGADKPFGGGQMLAQGRFKNLQQPT
jgi:hypothetical protein